MYPTPEQDRALLAHCAHAGFVWNLAVEQQSWWRPGRKSAPGYLEQSRQLTAARAENAWLAAGSQMVQQQALRDFARAMTGFFNETNGTPSWRKAGRDEGFRITGKRGAKWEVRRAKGTVGEPGRNVAAKATLNRGISRSAWGLLERRLEEKAPGRVKKINPAFTSQRCSACGLVDRKSRESQAAFRCTVCGYACNADVNAAKNIAAGRAVTARGGRRAAGPVNREPQLPLQSV